jgi:hypothetical protein
MQLFQAAEAAEEERATLLEMGQAAEALVAL